MIRRYALRDDQWKRIEAWLPGRRETNGVTARDNRLFVEALQYRYRAGIAWRDLPERFGDWKNVHRRFSRFRAIVTRYDKTARNFLVAVQLAAEVIWLN